jgi:hypothetical protein
LAALCALGCVGPVRAHAQGLEAGGHVGVGLDTGSIHLGGDLIVPLAQLSPNVRLSVWPSVALVLNDGTDGALFGADLPFEFEIANSIIKPFVGPGLAVGVFGDAFLKLNVIGGLFIDTGTVRPFAELAVRFIDGTFVDLLLGAVFEL